MLLIKLKIKWSSNFTTYDMFSTRTCMFLLNKTNIEKISNFALGLARIRKVQGYQKVTQKP